MKRHQYQIRRLIGMPTMVGTLLMIIMIAIIGITIMMATAAAYPCRVIEKWG